MLALALLLGAVPIAAALLGVPLVVLLSAAWYARRYELYAAFVEPNRGWASAGAMPLRWLWSSPSDQMHFVPVTGGTAPQQDDTAVYVDLAFVRFDPRDAVTIARCGNRIVPPADFLLPLLRTEAREGSVVLVLAGLCDALAWEPAATAAYVHALVHLCTCENVSRLTLVAAATGKDALGALRRGRRVVTCNTRTGGLCAVDCAASREAVPYVCLADMARAPEPVRRRDLAANRWWV